MIIQKVFICVCVKTLMFSVKLNVCICVTMSDLKGVIGLYLHLHVYVYACVLVCMSFSASSSNRCVYSRIIWCQSIVP